MSEDEMEKLKPLLAWLARRHAAELREALREEYTYGDHTDGTPLRDALETLGVWP